FHARYYMPNNAVLSIVGDVTPTQGLANADRYFGHIEPGEHPDRVLPEQLAPVGQPWRLDIAEDVPAPAVWFAGRLPPDVPTGRDIAAVKLAAAIVGEGETSRLHRRLVRKDEIALSAGFGVNPLIAGNSFGL